MSAFLESFVGIGFLAFFIAASVVGVRLVLLWRRTRELPELLIGLGVLGIGPVGFGFMTVGELCVTGAPSAARVLIGTGLVAMSIGSGAKYVFNWRVYHPRSGGLRALVTAACGSSSTTTAASTQSISGAFVGEIPGSGAFIGLATDGLRVRVAGKGEPGLSGEVFRPGVGLLGAPILVLVIQMEWLARVKPRQCAIDRGWSHRVGHRGLGGRVLEQLPADSTELDSHQQVTAQPPQLYPHPALLHFPAVIGLAMSADQAPLGFHDDFAGCESRRPEHGAVEGEY